jgi:hypothetical protein
MMAAEDQVHAVIPAKAGTQLFVSVEKRLGPGLRRDDG